MVTEIRIYFEGDTSLRRGFRTFIQRGCGTVVRTVSGGSRNDTIKDFMTALQTRTTALNLLLIDAEGKDDSRLFESLSKHRDWKPPTGATGLANRVFWMVQVMEAWFLADRAALKRYYGDAFRESALPRRTEVEQISKSDVDTALTEATKKTGKGPYHKTGHAPKLLELIDPKKVRKASPNCERLFQQLTRKSIRATRT